MIARATWWLLEHVTLSGAASLSAVLVGLTPLLGCSDGDAVSIRAAGGTMPAPLYRSWLEERPAAEVSYEALTSGEGIHRFLEGEIHMASTDLPLDPARMSGFLAIPVTASVLAVAYNPEGLPEGLRLSRATYPALFLGRIERWNDERVAADNPLVELPSSTVRLVVRTGESGMSYALSHHLSSMSMEWSAAMGKGAEPTWSSNAIQAASTEDAARTILETPGALGCVELGVARRLGLGIARLENRAGRFVAPSTVAGLAALLSSDVTSDGRFAHVGDPESEEAYPLATYSWMLVRERQDDPRRAAELRSFLAWCMDDGQRMSERHGFIRLAPRAVSTAQHTIERIRGRDLEEDPFGRDAARLQRVLTPAGSGVSVSSAVLRSGVSVRVWWELRPAESWPKFASWATATAEGDGFELRSRTEGELLLRRQTPTDVYSLRIERAPGVMRIEYEGAAW